MIRLGSLSKEIALRMLALDGIAAIWQLQVAAAIAHRAGHADAAASIMEIADSAERECLRSDALHGGDSQQ